MGMAIGAVLALAFAGAAVLIYRRSGRSREYSTSGSALRTGRRGVGGSPCLASRSNPHSGCCWKVPARSSQGWAHGAHRTTSARLGWPTFRAGCHESCQSCCLCLACDSPGMLAGALSHVCVMGWESQPELMALMEPSGGPHSPSQATCSPRPSTGSGSGTK